MDYQNLSKKARPVLFITAALQSILFCAVLLCGVYFIAIPSYYLTEAVFAMIAGVIVLLAVIWMIVSPLVRFRRYRYRIAEDRIEITEGIFFIRNTMVPIDRIHQIDIVRGPVDRHFGLAKVTVTTAGATATMRFLEIEKAQCISDTLNSIITTRLRSRRGDDNV
ncbi:MAG: PH domain-containing protein [Clostridia bacterium]|nr:PH domain-containing protein [Clostridia bacterium]